jgi:hypothetical protein
MFRRRKGTPSGHGAAKLDGRYWPTTTVARPTPSEAWRALLAAEAPEDIDRARAVFADALRRAS